jgi:hypothetical protein
MESVGGRGALTRLALVGSALTAVYVFGLAARYPFAASLTQPRASWASQVGATWLNLAVHVGVLLALTLLYLASLRIIHSIPTTRTRPTLALIVLFWLVSCAELFLASPAGESHDIFDYVFRGRMMTEIGANPLAETPITFRRMAYFRYLAWHSNVDTYGPLWEMASYAVSLGVRTALAALGGWASTQPSCPQSADSCRILVAYVSGYRLLAVLLSGLSGWLIYTMLRRNRPQLALAGLLTWLWNPLLVISSALGGHNDALMMVLLLLVLWLLQRRLWLLALLALLLAGHVKLTALALTPAVGLWVVRQIGWGRGLLTGLVAGGIGLALSWLLYAPFDGWGTLPQMLYERSIFFANSIWRVFFRLAYVHAGWDYATAWRLSVQLPTYLFVALSLIAPFWMLGFLPRRWRQEMDWRDDRLLWRVVLVVSLLYLLLGSFWFQHWYVVWVLAPAALLPNSRITRALLPWLCFGALAANGAESFLAGLPGLALGTTTLAAIAVVIIWGPALIATAVEIVRVASTRPLRSADAGHG